MTVDVFISYSRAQRANVEAITQAIEKEGWSYFLDAQGIDGGANFPDVIDKAVKSARIVLGCWSKLAFSRPWVMQECRVGRARGVLVPVAVERFDELDVPTEFFGLHHVDLSDFAGVRDDPSWQELRRSILKLLQAPTAATTTLSNSHLYVRPYDWALFYRQLGLISQYKYENRADFERVEKDSSFYYSLTGGLRQVIADAFRAMDHFDEVRSSDAAIIPLSQVMPRTISTDSGKDRLMTDFEPIHPRSGDPFDPEVMEAEVSPGTSGVVDYCARPGVREIERGYQISRGRDETTVLKALVRLRG